MTLFLVLDIDIYVRSQCPYIQFIFYTFVYIIITYYYFMRIRTPLTLYYALMRVHKNSAKNQAEPVSLLFFFSVWLLKYTVDSCFSAASAAAAAAAVVVVAVDAGAAFSSALMLVLLRMWCVLCIFVNLSITSLYAFTHHHRKYARVHTLLQEKCSKNNINLTTNNNNNNNNKPKSTK